MYPLDQQFYSASLREKGGELRALRSLDKVSKDRLLPILVALPLSEKENANFTLEGLVKREVGRVQSSWEQRVCLWDSRFLVFDRDNATEDGKWLGKLLTQFSVFRTRIIPVVGLREKVHRTSVLASHARDSGSGMAIRINFDDIQDYELLASTLKNLRTVPEDCVLVVDISDADISEHDEFAKSLVGWLFALKAKGNWAKIILTGSSFPIKNPAPVMGDATSPRLEWKLWKWTIGIEPGLRDFVMFGDFGADNAHFKFEGGGRPIPHLRYTSDPDWHTVRGDTTYPSLRGVSKRITDSGYYQGRDFSEGDEFIWDCGAGTINTADPTAWRAVNMNHHMTQVIVDLANFYGIKLPTRRSARPKQADLFAEQPETQKIET
jgi:hypothetical protein